MNNINFYKYQGTGNDFIVIDNRKGDVQLNSEQIQKLCNRHFGIGSDGLILIESSKSADFDMNFFNPDGSKSFCGNGSRCAVAFAHAQGIIEKKCSFNAIDGLHYGTVVNNQQISVSVRDVAAHEKINDHYFIHTGSPHYIIYANDIDSIDIVPEAHEIRYNNRFAKEGTNVNFVQVIQDGIRVRTYERGVEAETLSCGSGVTACALSFAIQHPELTACKVETKGGVLTVEFKRNQNTFSEIRLIGPAIHVFKGEWNG